MHKIVWDILQYNDIILYIRVPYIICYIHHDGFNQKNKSNFTIPPPVGSGPSKISNLECLKGQG